MESDSLRFGSIPGGLKLSHKLADPTKSGILAEALVDPHIYPEEPGLAPASRKSEDGASHLRRLRGELGESASAGPGAKGVDGVPIAGNISEFEERRKTPRLRCSGSAEFRVEGTEARMWGTLTDVSLHGCYVEMSNTFPIDTIVDLVLKSCGIRIQVPGRVRATYPALGMGICFTQIEPVQQLQLQQLLALLAGRGAASVGRPVQENHVKQAEPGRETPRLGDPEALLAEIMTFFQKNQLLSRDEFYEIAKRARRPESPL